MSLRLGKSWVCTLALLPSVAGAHSFGVIYTLPIPFWLYAWGASAALVASFVVLGLFARHKPAAAEGAVARYAIPAGLLGGLRALSLAGFALCLATGWLGTASPYGNFNMTFFWIVFLLGFAYFTALVGDWFALISPWRTLAELLRLRGRFTYPEKLGYWPATLLYMGFIWFELMGESTPLSLANALAGYSLLTLLGAWAFGKSWFRYGEFFGVLLRQFGRLAPIALEGTRLRLRKPLAGLLESQPEPRSLILFVLFMLSSTAFDGLHEAKPWVQLFWVDLYREVLMGRWLPDNPFAAYPSLRVLWQYWQSGWLTLSPFLYLGVYALGMRLVWLAGARHSSPRELALRFLPSLLPIVLVYHITHYYTLIETQGVKIIALASDPFGWNWNLFGTAEWYRGSLVPDMNIVWHVQVGLIVLGHIASVVVAHLEALRLYPTPTLATLSQVPMLVLMVLFTTAGLWILAQPLQSPG